jgi:hypothetical protein
MTPVRIQAPSTPSAMALLGDLATFGHADLLPLAQDRWEVCVSEPGASLSELLTAIERWATVWRLGATTVYIDDVEHSLTPDGAAGAA